MFDLQGVVKKTTTEVTNIWNRRENSYFKKKFIIIFLEIENQIFWIFCVDTVFSDVEKLQDKGLISMQLFSEQKIMQN